MCRLCRGNMWSVSFTELLFKYSIPHIITWVQLRWIYGIIVYQVLLQEELDLGVEFYVEQVEPFLCFSWDERAVWGYLRTSLLRLVTLHFARKDPLWRFHSFRVVRFCFVTFDKWLSKKRDSVEVWWMIDLRCASKLVRLWSFVHKHIASEFVFIVVMLHCLATGDARARRGWTKNDQPWTSC